MDVDLQSGKNVSIQAYSWLEQALEEGQITLADLQTSVSHVLTMKFAAGLFDAPYTPEDGLAILNSPQHRQLALEGARQGIVLAKNDGGLLPLKLGPASDTGTVSGAPDSDGTAGTVTKIALIGPMTSCEAKGSNSGSILGASNRGMPVRDPTPHFCSAREAMVGAYALDDGSTDIPLLPAALAPLLPTGLSVTVTRGANTTTPPDEGEIAAAVVAARAADVAIVAIGDDQSTCAESVDRSSLDPPGGQLALLQALATNTTTPLVVVLFNGRPATFGPSLGKPLLARIGALLIASNPGALGGQAVAEILLGLVNPSGRLADSWAAVVGHMGSSAQPFQQLVNGKWLAHFKSSDPDGRVYPTYQDDQWAPSEPLFPMLHGLSYTLFSYEAISATVVTPRSSLPQDLNSPADLRMARATSAVQVSVKVCNTGPRDGSEVVAIYSRDPRGGSGGARLQVPYWKRLVGFTRLPLSAGSCGTAVVNVTVDDLATHTADDPAGAQLVLRVLAGTYTFSTGPNARADSLTTSLAL